MTLRSYLLQKLQEKLQRINRNNEMCFTRNLAFYSLKRQFFGQWKQMIKEICFSIFMNRKLVSPWPSTFVLNKYLKCFVVMACQATSLPGVATCCLALVSDNNWSQLCKSGWVDRGKVRKGQRGPGRGLGNSQACFKRVWMPLSLFQDSSGCSQVALPWGTHLAMSFVKLSVLQCPASFPQGRGTQGTPHRDLGGTRGDQHFLSQLSMEQAADLRGEQVVRSWGQRAGQRERKHEGAFCALTVGVAEREGPLGLVAAAEGCGSGPLSGVHMKASTYPSIPHGQAVPAREVAPDRQPCSKSFLPERILKVRDPEE